MVLETCPRYRKRKCGDYSNCFVGKKKTKMALIYTFSGDFNKLWEGAKTTTTVKDVRDPH